MVTKFESGCAFKAFVKYLDATCLIIWYSPPDIIRGEIGCKIVRWVNLAEDRRKLWGLGVTGSGGYGNASSGSTSVMKFCVFLSDS